MNLNSILFLFAVLVTSCTNQVKEKKIAAVHSYDPHSYSKPEITRVNHLSLNLDIRFDLRIMVGIAEYSIDQVHGNELILDSKSLIIDSILDEQNVNLTFSISPEDKILGSALVIKLKNETSKVRIFYKTHPEAIALQWLIPEQTFSKKYPFLFTQSQSIYARSWIPCPDGPGIRFTYDAKVRVPKGMMAAMSATNPIARNKEGIYYFEMNLPVPAYLLAIAVGDFDFKPIGKRTGVYAEPHILDRAVKEFADLEKMLEAAEGLYGDYPWDRYDVIVLPPSFPFGGMENPKLTFLTPTVIVGDQSLTSLLAHELAHSWSGNLVTNETWNDFWLNEGFTTYFESRIMETLYGKDYADMLSLLGYQDLQKTMKEFTVDDPMTKLNLDLRDGDPQDALSDIAYEKGKLFLRMLDEYYGREKLDTFLRKYLNDFKFKSMNSERFVAYLNTHLLKGDSVMMQKVNQWIYETGLPEFMPSYSRTKFDAIEKQVHDFVLTEQYQQLNTKNWSTHEWLHFIRKLPEDKGLKLIPKLDRQFDFSNSKNAEIAVAWYEYAIRNSYGKNILPQLDEFLTQIGRRKFLMPIYKAMMEMGLKQEALEIFEKARKGYHPISENSVSELLN
ncbi:MAG: M1 family metallopeptidase [Bacteroidota bacterium]|nr:M1 family metallopeptidase [Bacteroidota bacterium]